MLPVEHVVELSRWQFAITALFHFLFVPLTLGLAWLLVAMEIMYVKTGNVIYKDMTQFWGKLFGINFALGVVGGIVLEFELGMNWAYYSQYIGNIFGTSLAVEGTLGFMLESTMFGIFFFGWNKLSKLGHLAVTFFLALGTSFSALMILVSNGFMQHPVGVSFDYQTMRMELDSFSQVFFNPTAQAMFAHTITAGLVTGAIFVLGISAYFILKGKDLAFAKRSFAMALPFGLVSLLGAGFYGDHVGLDVAEAQPMKMAALEGVWNTPAPPAAWNLIAAPSNKEKRNLFSVQIPDALSLIAHHNLTGTVEGLNDIVKTNETRIASGQQAYMALEQLRKQQAGQLTLTPAQLAQAETTFANHKADLGYGLLLAAQVPDVSEATPAQIAQVAKSALPENVWSVFYGFRLMLLCFGLMLLLVLVAIYYLVKGTLWQKRWLFKAALYSIPLPFLASEFGWFIAEHGRQPWVVEGVLPTGWGSSDLPATQLGITLAGFLLFYALMFLVELKLMFKYARLGPSSLKTGRYHLEQQQPNLIV
jgi:cytochrome d ubiquinol oxidase subunit I